MTFTAAEGRRQLLDTVATATDHIGLALAALGDAYEQLDEHSADRLEDELFRPVQAAYARARRTHAEFAARHSLPSRAFAPPPDAGVHGVKDQLLRATAAVETADHELAELQDSMLPVDVGDPEVRAGLAEVRTLLGDLPGRARRLVSVFGR